MLAYKLYKAPFMFRLLLLAALGFSLPAKALDLILPEYRNDSFNQSVLLSWQDQLAGLAAVNARITTPLPQVVQTLERKAASAALIEIPPVFYHRALELGWTPLSSLRDLAYMIQHALPETDDIKTIGTPPRATIAARIATQITPGPFVEFKDHEHCIRAVASTQVDTCVTAARFVKAYSERFGIEFETIGEGRSAPPSVIMASSQVPAETLDAIRNLNIKFPRGWVYIPFDLERDGALLDTLIEG